MVQPPVHSTNREFTEKVIFVELLITEPFPLSLRRARRGALAGWACMHFQIKRCRLLAASIFQHGQGPSVRHPSVLCTCPRLSFSLSLSLSLPLDVVGLEGVSEGDRAKAAHYKYWTKFRRTRDHSSRTLPSHIFGVWPEPRRFAAAGVGNGVSLLTGMAGQGARMICGDTFSPARHFYGLESRNNNFMTILRRQATKRHLQTVT